MRVIIPSWRPQNFSDAGRASKIRVSLLPQLRIKRKMFNLHLEPIPARANLHAAPQCHQVGSVSVCVTPCAPHSTPLGPSVCLGSPEGGSLMTDATAVPAQMKQITGATGAEPGGVQEADAHGDRILGTPAP